MAAIENCHYYYITSGLLKLWVATHKWVAEPSDVGHENASCKNIITVIISVNSDHKYNAAIILLALGLTSDFLKM